MTAALLILALAFAQNVTFSIVSRSRNRDHRLYHVSASVLSNVTWFLTFKQLLAHELSWAIFPFYVVGTTAGSEWGRVISMRIERALFARSDAHVWTATTSTSDPRYQTNQGAQPVRYAVGLGLAYVLLVRFFYAGHTVGSMEQNASDAKWSYSAE